MPKYLFVYHGGGMPETEEEQAATMQAWGVFMQAVDWIDPGAPTSQSKTVSADGVTDGGGVNPTSGYGLVEAADIDAACEIAKQCPIASEPGGTIEVAETFEIEM